MRKKNNFVDEEKNPCLKESQLTIKCYERHSYDREKCFFEIENYKACKKFWGEVGAFRRSQGTYPALPPLAERERVKREYLASKKKQ
ncbi:unnamed protein product [Ceutorhynchus assimilis]|uniref:Coiled-coil-helix-coiled-coil-helix domain-containing protein 7 n=1 Tax=Ceutorhynchus assimilis TaxID=467358 RepID=A0A9N9MHY6_9CUCU|nr:unnamed protein product [Ceutorhynchus assimilis]